MKTSCGGERKPAKVNARTTLLVLVAIIQAALGWPRAVCPAATEGPGGRCPEACCAGSEIPCGCCEMGADSCGIAAVPAVRPPAPASPSPPAIVRPFATPAKGDDRVPAAISAVSVRWQAAFPEGNHTPRAPPPLIPGSQGKQQGTRT